MIAAAMLPLVVSHGVCRAKNSIGISESATRVPIGRGYGVCVDHTVRICRQTGFPAGPTSYKDLRGCSCSIRKEKDVWTYFSIHFQRWCTHFSRLAHVRSSAALRGLFFIDMKRMVGIGIVSQRDRVRHTPVGALPAAGETPLLHYNRAGTLQDLLVWMQCMHGPRTSDQDRCNHISGVFVIDKGWSIDTYASGRHQKGQSQLVAARGPARTGPFFECRYRYVRCYQSSPFYVYLALSSVQQAHSA